MGSSPVADTPGFHRTRARVPIRQTTPELGSVPPPGHHRSPTSPCFELYGTPTFSHHTPASPSPLSKQLSTSSSSSSRTHARWHSTGANGAGSELSGAAGDSGLDASQLHYVTAYSPTDLRTFHCNRIHCPGLTPAMPIGFLCKMGRIGSSSDRG